MLRTTLQHEDWKKTCDGDVVTRFQCAANHHEITASPEKMDGPGWIANIHGSHTVCMIAYACMHITD